MFPHSGPDGRTPARRRHGFTRPMPGCDPTRLSTIGRDPGSAPDHHPWFHMPRWSTDRTSRPGGPDPGPRDRPVALIRRRGGGPRVGGPHRARAPPGAARQRPDARRRATSGPHTPHRYRRGPAAGRARRGDPGRRAAGGRTIPRPQAHRVSTVDASPVPSPAMASLAARHRPHRPLRDPARPPSFPPRRPRRPR